jgi:crossover junction endodeoxyribonuclease RusA
MELELPFPPSANRYWRNVNGRMVKSAEARAYRDEAGYACLLQMYGKSRGRPLTGHIKAELDFYFPSERGDLDNRIKVVLDALQGLAFENDSQIRFMKTPSRRRLNGIAVVLLVVLASAGLSSTSAALTQSAGKSLFCAHGSIGMRPSPLPPGFETQFAVAVVEIQSAMEVSNVDVTEFSLFNI